MSDRERWTVYPLLFLTLLLHAKRALNEPVGNDLTCNLLRCNELIVESLNGQRRVRIGSSRQQAGQVVVYGSAQQESIKIHALENGLHGTVEIFDHRGQGPKALIGIDEGGGFAELLGPDQIPAIFLGHDQEQQVSGMLAKGEDDKVAAITTADGEKVVWGTLFRWQMLTGSEQGEVVQEPAADASEAPTSKESESEPE